MWDWIRNLSNIQVDISTHCNASCGECQRNQMGGAIQPGLVLQHFPMDLWKRFCEQDTKYMRIGRLTFNGNWGDPMMHPKLVEMIDMYIQHHPESLILIATNGSLRTHKFWYSLGKTLSKVSHKLEFAVDGLEDTHAIYRRGTSFKKLSDNIKSFVDGGGYTQPVITLFDHNKHQIPDIIQHLKNLGAQAVEIRGSYAEDTMVDASPDDQYLITAPKDVQGYEEIWTEPSLTEPHIKWDLYNKKIKTSNTKCPWYNRAEIQIDPTARVYPCCHVSSLGTRVNKRDNGKEYTTVGDEMNKFNNLRNSSLEHILDNDFFRNTIPNTIYSNKPWMVCTKSCEVHLNEHNIERGRLDNE